MKNEIWRNVAGGWYAVSDQGRVRRNGTGRILKQDRPMGYRQVTLTIRGISHRRKVHALVLEGFLGPRPVGFEINHKNSNKADNRRVNLEYVTKKQNAEHAVAAGRYRWGEQFWKSRATGAIVMAIRAQYHEGNGAALGRVYGLSRATVHNIVARKTWTHI